MPWVNVTLLLNQPRKIQFYNAIVNVKDGWDQLPASTITKCFKISGISDYMFDGIEILSEDQTEHQTQQEPDDFDCWFAYLLEVLQDEYLTHDDKLEMEAPSRAPTAMPTPMDDHDHDKDEELVENIPQIAIDSATDQLQEM